MRLILADGFFQLVIIETTTSFCYDFVLLRLQQFFEWMRISWDFSMNFKDYIENIKDKFTTYYFPNWNWSKILNLWFKLEYEMYFSLKFWIQSPIKKKQHILKHWRFQQHDLKSFLWIQKKNYSEKCRKRKCITTNVVRLSDSKIIRLLALTASWS